MLRSTRSCHSLNLFAIPIRNRHRRKGGMARLAFLNAALLASTSCSLFTKLPTALESADDARKSGKFEEAIILYRQHLQQRVDARWKIQNENPYFWLLTIGDVYLESENPLKAKETYDQARLHNVDRPLLVDRYLTLATWYKKHGDVLKAIAVLKEYRPLDTLLFNGELDTISKELVAQQDGE